MKKFVLIFGIILFGLISYSQTKNISSSGGNVVKKDAQGNVVIEGYLIISKSGQIIAFSDSAVDAGTIHAHIASIVPSGVESGTADGQMLFWDTDTWKHSETNELFWDDASKKLGIGTVTPTEKLHVDGSIRTDSTFYGDYWVSATGNSMYIQPTGDTDDFFSFKTPADRPTIKREGGKFVYFESSNVYDVGISFRADDTYSGTLNYEKDNHMMTVLGKNSPFGFKANSDYDDYIKIQTTSNVPEITTVGAADLKINAGGANDLLLNHNGGNVGIGTVTPGAKLDVAGHIWQTSTGKSVFLGEGAGAVDDLTDNQNVFVGYEAGKSVISAPSNVYIGYQSGFTNITNNDNVCIGYQSGYSSTSAYNVYIGWAAAHSNTDGQANVAVGRSSGMSNTTGDYNVFLGEGAGAKISGGTNNTITNNSVFVGRDSRANADSETNQIVIGYEAIGKGSNTAVIGDDNVTDVYLSEDEGATGRMGGLRLAGSTTMTSVSTGAANNDKMITQGHMDDAIEAATGAIVYSTAYSATNHTVLLSEEVIIFTDTGAAKDTCWLPDLYSGKGVWIRRGDNTNDVVITANDLTTDGSTNITNYNITGTVNSVFCVQESTQWNIILIGN